MEKIGCDKQYCPCLCSPNQYKITDHAKCFEQMKFPKLWKNYTLLVDIFLAVTEKKPLQNHMTHVSLVIQAGC